MSKRDRAMRRTPPIRTLFHRSVPYVVWSLIIAASLLFHFHGYARAANITLAWDVESGAAGYKIYYGTASDTYTTSVDVGNVATYTMALADGYTYYLAATAYDSSHLESAFSGEISYTSCSFTLSSTSASIGVSGGSGSLTVTTQTGCSWSASTGVSWAALTSGSSGTGSGTVSYTVSANTGSSRTAAFTIAGKTFALTQAGASSYAIVASAGAGGSISPSGTVTVASGGSKIFTITPNTGYTVSSVTVDGNSVGAVTSYTFSNVTANHAISAAFANKTAKTYTITASAGTGGSISPSGGVSVVSGASQSFSITPGAGYSVSSVTVDGSSVGPVTSYLFQNVAADHTIEATFAAGTSDQGIPRIAISNSTVNVGTVKMGAAASKILTIRNNGAGSLDFGTLAITGDNAGEFSTSTNCSALPKHESCTITVSLAATSFGSKAATLTIPSNDPKKPAAAVKLKGMCAPPKVSVSSQSVNFGAISVSAASPARKVTIRNNGVSDLVISSISESGDTSFAVADNPCGTLVKGGSCVVQLTFTPSAEGPVTSSLIISSNDPSKETVSIKLSGKGK